MTSFLIPYLCITMNMAPGKQTNACNSALIAASIQSGIKNNLDDLEKHITRDITEITGEQVWAVSLTGYKILKDKEVIVNTRINPVADNLQMTIRDDQAKVKFSWYF